MIARIKGTLLEKQPPQLLVDVSGVGYELEAPMTTFYQLPEIGQTVVLHTHFVVREDAQLLYGFYERQERELFRTLIRVNGVGPKMALAILSGIEGDEFVRCVQDNDIQSLVKIPGIGKKTAERLVIEIRDRLVILMGGSSGLNSGSVIEKLTPQSAVSEAESALMALGYKPKEAAKAVSAFDTVGLSSEEIIRRALKSMVN